MQKIKGGPLGPPFFYGLGPQRAGPPLSLLWLGLWRAPAVRLWHSGSALGRYAVQKLYPQTKGGQYGPSALCVSTRGA